MAIGYGSAIKLSKLSSSSIGIIYKTHDEGFSWTSILRIITTIIEVGVVFIPGIGVAAETAVGLIGGAINEALDVKEHNTNVIGGLLNFGAPLTGGGFSALKNIKNIAKISEGATIMDELAVIEENIDEAEAFGEMLDPDYLEYAKEHQEMYKKFDDFRIEQSSKGFDNSLDPNEIFDKIEYGSSKFSIADKGVKIFDNSNKQTLSTLREIGNLSSDVGIKTADNIAKSTYEDLEDKLNSARFTRDEIDNIMNILNRSSAGQVEASNSLKLFNEELQRILIQTKNIKKIDFINRYLSTYNKIAEALSSTIIREESIIFRAFSDSLKTIEYETKKTIDKNWLKRLFKYSGSREFNDKYVQRLQLIDPNDLGRAPVEHLYQVLRKRLNKYFARISKSYKSINEIEKTWESVGGTVVDSSWILGFRIINGLEVMGSKLVQIKFKASATNNKRDVLVWAKDYQLEKMLVSSPGKTYQRYWALSKGGAAINYGSIFKGSFSVFGSGKKISMEMNSILGFIPVQQLKNWLSIVSNYVENFSDIAKHKYTKTYFSKLKNSFVRTSISRTFRLAGKIMLGGAAGRKFGKEIGRFVGAEAQRVGTQIIAHGIKNLMHTNKKGEHNWGFGHGLAKSAERGALVSVRSNVLRKARKNNKNSAIINMLSARRKLQQVKRIPNAVVPGRPFKGIKIK